MGATKLQYLDLIALCLSKHLDSFFVFFFFRMRLTRCVQFHTEFGVPLDTHRSNYTEEIFHRISEKSIHVETFFFLFLSLHFSTKKQWPPNSAFHGKFRIHRTYEKKEILQFIPLMHQQTFLRPHFICKPNDWIIYYGTGVWLFNKCQAVWKYGTCWIFMNINHIHGNIAWNLTPFTHSATPSFFPQNLQVTC